MGKGLLTLAALAAFAAGAAHAASPGSVQQISSDSFTNPASQHETEVEPDTFAFGPTVVAAFQVGRFFDGGSSSIGFATSIDAGQTWRSGILPGLTGHSRPTGWLQRASDPSVAYDAVHGVWLISILGVDLGPRGPLTSLVVSRSHDGVSWTPPVLASRPDGSFDYDKSWITCDNWPSSPFRGHCYLSYSDGDMRVMTTTSRDGGRSWRPPTSSLDPAFGSGVQPLVRPDGTLVIPFLAPGDARIAALLSRDGGVGFGGPVAVASIRSEVPLGMRAPPLPSAEIDGSGRIFVAWQDCRFRVACRTNDIVYSTSSNGADWTAAARIPIDASTSGIDHFTPGLAVDPQTQGTSARVALAYYSVAGNPCRVDACLVEAGFVSSADGGATWSAPLSLSTQPMSLGWMPNTTSGRMLGDYISTSFASGYAVPVLPLAAPADAAFHQATFGASLALPSSPPRPPSSNPPAPLPSSSSVTLTASPPVVVYGRKVVLSGRVSNRRSGEAVTVGGRATVTTRRGGVWSYVAVPRIFTAYQALWQEAPSSAVYVRVRPRVTLTSHGILFTARVVAARSFGGQSVLIQRRRSGRWVTLKRIALSPQSSQSFALSLPQGRSLLRAVIPTAQAGAGYVAGFSRPLTIRR